MHLVSAGDGDVLDSGCRAVGVPLRDRSVGRVPRADGRGGAGGGKALDGVTPQGEPHCHLIVTP